jgi:fructan beta-fructosidase
MLSRNRSSPQKNKHMNMNSIFLKLTFFVVLTICMFSRNAAVAQQPAGLQEQHRPQFHFSPKAHWMNDPNGMVYYNGVYHLFYQYYPQATVWGPMHWGHATTKDLFHWEERPIALYPDSLGYIFSGSIVVDKNNSSGLGKDGVAPMVAIFTHHDPKLEQKKQNNFQNQSIAYSLDEGATWTKYSGNPVLPNPGITDFRDPKVMWYEAGKKWIMTLATKDRITFYSSVNLKDWNKESEFGKNLGAHGGVWECPDLFPMTYNGKTTWVLLVSINPGGPNGGSATQYFTGDFNGKTFAANSVKEKWLDFGTDNYAGVTWSNTGERKIFIGWMNNWQYANQVPTKNWRGATTIARDLQLDQVGGEYYVRAIPAKELNKHFKPVYKEKVVSLKTAAGLSSSSLKKLNGCFKVDLVFDPGKDLKIALNNKEGETLLVGYDHQTKTYSIDRTKSGASDFEKGFARRHSAPRISSAAAGNISLVLDVASVELFADKGLTVMTDVFFPESPMNGIMISGSAGQKVTNLVISAVR